MQTTLGSEGYAIKQCEVVSKCLNVPQNLTIWHKQELEEM